MSLSSVFLVLGKKAQFRRAFPTLSPWNKFPLRKGILEKRQNRKLKCKFRNVLLDKGLWKSWHSGVSQGWLHVNASSHEFYRSKELSEVRLFDLFGPMSRPAWPYFGLMSKWLGCHQVYCLFCKKHIGIDEGFC